ncbi:MAG: ubiquitin-like domain-containing protein [Acutalibacteraceae bacterium]
MLFIGYSRGVGSVVVMATTGKATILITVSYRVNLTTIKQKILEKANIQVGSNDIVERDDTNGVVIKIRREMAATVEADGAEQTVSAHYGDKVSDVIAEAGVVLDDNDAINVDINGELTDNTDLVVTRYHKVTVYDNGTTQMIDVPEGTVANVLPAANITLGEEDTLSVAKQSRLQMV